VCNLVYKVQHEHNVSSGVLKKDHFNTKGIKKTSFNIEKTFISIRLSVYKHFYNTSTKEYNFRRVIKIIYRIQYNTVTQRFLEIYYFHCM